MAQHYPFRLRPCRLRRRCVNTLGTAHPGSAGRPDGVRTGFARLAGRLEGMFLKSALVVAALIVAELAGYLAAVGRLNPLFVTLICVGLSAFGVQFLLKQAAGLVAGVGRQSGALDEAALADRAVKVFAAGLLAFPGMLTGLVGLLLFVGPVRGVVASLLGSRLASLLPAEALSGFSFVSHGVHGDIVDVTSTLKDPAPSSTSAHGAHWPELSSNGT